MWVGAVPTAPWARWAVGRMAAMQVYSRVFRETRGLSIIDGTLKAACLGSEVSQRQLCP